MRRSSRIKGLAHESLVHLRPLTRSCLPDFVDCGVPGRRRSSQPSPAKDLPKALTCTFETGTSIAYAGGDYKASEAKPLAFTISAIDLENQRAELGTEKGGKGELKVVVAVNANHFLEVVNEGFINITTVYDLDPQRKAHPAVHSRHLGLLGEPIIAQYYGFCVPK